MLGKTRYWVGPVLAFLLLGSAAGDTVLAQTRSVTAATAGKASLANGYELLKAKDYRGAISAFVEGLAKSPNNALGHFYYAAALEGVGESIAAAGEYKMALSLGLGPQAQMARERVAALENPRTSPETVLARHQTAAVEGADVDLSAVPLPHVRSDPDQDWSVGPTEDPWGLLRPMIGGAWYDRRAGLLYVLRWLKPDESVAISIFVTNSGEYEPDQGITLSKIVIMSTPISGAPVPAGIFLRNCNGVTPWDVGTHICLKDTSPNSPLIAVWTSGGKPLVIRWEKRGDTIVEVSRRLLDEEHKQYSPEEVHDLVHLTSDQAEQLRQSSIAEAETKHRQAVDQAAAQAANQRAFEEQEQADADAQASEDRASNSAAVLGVLNGAVATMQSRANAQQQQRSPAGGGSPGGMSPVPGTYTGPPLSADDKRCFQETQCTYPDNACLDRTNSERASRGCPPVHWAHQ